MNILGKFRICPHVYLTVLIEKAITEFLAFYRHTFPDSTVTVKLHLLEDHLVGFLRQWEGVGFGIMGEQGAEGIHADFNSLKRRFGEMPDAVERLRCTIQEHHLRCTPQNIASKPPIKKGLKLEEKSHITTEHLPAYWTYSLISLLPIPRLVGVHRHTADQV
jgi:hypothetical protein